MIIYTIILPTPPTPTSGSSVETPPPATAKNNEEPPPSFLFIPKAQPPISEKNAESPPQASLAKRLGFNKLSNVTMSNFLTTHLGTKQVYQQEFEGFRDFVQKKIYLKKKKKKKESTTSSDNEAFNILEESVQGLLSEKRHKMKKYKIQ